MNRNVVITARAARDIDEITDWWKRERSAIQAERWYRGVYSEISKLGEQPERYPISHVIDDLPYEIREMHFSVKSRPTHRVFFLVLPSNVIVLAIRHTSQNDPTSGDLTFG